MTPYYQPGQPRRRSRRQEHDEADISLAVDDAASASHEPEADDDTPEDEASSHPGGSDPADLLADDLANYNVEQPTGGNIRRWLRRIGFVRHPDPSGPSSR